MEHWLDVVDDEVSVVVVVVAVVVVTELSSGSPSAPSTTATRAPTPISKDSIAQLRFGCPSVCPSSARLSGHPASIATTVPPTPTPRNKAAITPAARLPTIAVAVWWQHTSVVATEVDA
jgi:hypothetical protein